MLSSSKESPDNAFGAVQMFLDVTGDIAPSACDTLSSQFPPEFEKSSGSHARLRLSLDRTNNAPNRRAWPRRDA
jgi:hypothetical protein